MAESQDEIEHALTLRPDKRIIVYLSSPAWKALKQMVGDDGKLSPVINRLILEAAAQNKAKQGKEPI